MPFRTSISDYSIVHVRAEIAKLGAGAPLLMVCGAVSDARNNRFPSPSVAESYTLNSTTVPQLAVGAGNVMGALFEIVPLVPLDAAVVVAPCVPDQLIRL